MPIDAYSLCPGGTGKKIKFCCADFLRELEKIDRLLEGDQTAACLQQIERLLAGGPPRACLLAIKGMLLRSGGQLEAAAANAAAFLQRFPDNPVALAESAILAAIEGQPQDGYRATPEGHGRRQRRHGTSRLPGHGDRRRRPIGRGPVARRPGPLAHADAPGRRRSGAGGKAAGA